MCSGKTIPHRKLIVYFHFTSRLNKTEKKAVYNIFLYRGICAYTEMKSKSFLPSFSTFNLFVHTVFLQLSSFCWRTQHITFQMSFLKNINITLTKFLTIRHYTTKAASQGSLKCLSRYPTNNYFSHFTVAIAFSSSDLGRTFVVIHRATSEKPVAYCCLVYFRHILAATKQGNSYTVIYTRAQQRKAYEQGRLDGDKGVRSAQARASTEARSCSQRQKIGFACHVRALFCVGGLKTIGRDCY